MKKESVLKGVKIGDMLIHDQDTNPIPSKVCQIGGGNVMVFKTLMFKDNHRGFQKLIIRIEDGVDTTCMYSKGIWRFAKENELS